MDTEGWEQGLQPSAAGSCRAPAQAEGGGWVGVGRQVHLVRLRRHRALVLQLGRLYHAPHRHLCTEHHPGAVHVRAHLPGLASLFGFRRAQEGTEQVFLGGN